MRALGRRRVALAAVVAVVASLLTVGLVWAHAELSRAEPAPGSVLSSPPVRVRLWFTEPVEAGNDAVVLIGPDGQRLNTGGAQVAPGDGTLLETNRLSASAPGTYTVRWRVVSADGHPIGGQYQFSVGATSAAGTPVAEPAIPGGPGLPGLGRWLHLLGLALALGPLGLALLAMGLPTGRDLERRLWALSRAGAGLLVLASALMLVAQGIGIGGSASEGLRAEMLRAALASRWGALWEARLGLALALLVLASWRVSRARIEKADTQPRFAAVGLALGSPLLVLTSLNGHPASTEPVWLSVFMDWIHLAATVSWLGGLFALGMVMLPALRGRSGGQAEPLLGRLVSRFSILALVCVEALVLTGLYATWAQVGTPEVLSTTEYGQTLLIKLGLAAVVVAVGAVNLLVTRPRLVAVASAKADSGPREGAVVGRFGRLLGVEVVLSIGILAAAGVLTSLPPARGAVQTEVGAAAAQPGLTLAQHAGPALVTLSFESADAGANRLTVSLHDQLGEPITDARVRVRARPPEETGGAASVTAMAPEGGRYRAAVSLPSAGRWRLEVLVARPGEPEQAAPFELVLPVPGAKDLLALADETMNGLRSVVEHNVLTDGKGVVDSVYEFEAPDRMRFVAQTASGEVETYGIGLTRYDRRGGAPWTVEPWPDTKGFRWPSFDFATSASDVTLLGREETGEVECFVVGFLEERGQARIRVWIGTKDHLIHRLVMMAPGGHYMTSEYSRFNQPLDIKPPVPSGG